MIQVDDVYKGFDGTPVLRGASLEVRDGETLTVIGRSGSGKSVLLKHMIRLLTPDRGRVLVDGTDLSAISYDELREVRQQFGVLFQGGALFDSMTAGENVAFPLKTFTREPPAEIQRRMERCLDVVDLPHVRDQKPSELSGGQRKRVALARAIALEPRYILYDEPTSGLDPETSNKINDLIQHLAEQLSVTSIVITHDMHSVLAIADRAAFIHKGTIRWAGTIDEMHRCEDPVLCAFVKASEYQIGPASAAAAYG